MTSNTIKVIFTVLSSLVLLTPAVVGYAMHWRLEAYAGFAISVYGIYSLVYFLLQILFSELNNKKITKDVKQRPNGWNEIPVGVVVVGYREDKQLLRRCLESIKMSSYKNIRRVIFVVDGNTEEDTYMSDVYTEVFGNNVMTVDFLLSNTKDVDYSTFGSDNICIMQPHGGKREGLYTGFKLLMQDPEIKAVITTDSDTILSENAVLELVYQTRHDDVGAVAGQIEVWNTSKSWLTHVISYRYWMSFNLERAAESFWRTVLCVAGPMACYKMETLKVVIEEWFHQKFLGQQCTFGDDRHLTNRVLLKGKKVVYTKYALGYTHTPSGLGTYFLQQTRWSKSYFREFLFNMQSVALHPFWMCYELCYNVVYFFLLMYWSLYILYFCSIYQQSVALLVTVGMSILKSLYGVGKTKRFGFLYFWMYSVVYFLAIIPAKIGALVTLWDMKWGTRGKGSNFLQNYWSFMLWFATLVGGFVYTVTKNTQFQLGENYYYTVAFVSWITVLSLFVVSYVSELISRKMKWLSNDLEKEIMQEQSADIEMSTF
jgi:hyaluronan synthase